MSQQIRHSARIITLFAITILSAFVISKPALADTYFIEPLQSSPEIKSQQASRFEKILVQQAKLILPGTVVNKRKQADTTLKPILLVTATGTQLVIERYDIGELLSVVEIPEIDAQPVDSWDRISARAIREVIYGNFQRPSKSLIANLSHLRVGHAVPIAAQ